MIPNVRLTSDACLYLTSLHGILSEDAVAIQYYTFIARYLGLVSWDQVLPPAQQRARLLNLRKFIAFGSSADQVVGPWVRKFVCCYIKTWRLD